MVQVAPLEHPPHTMSTQTINTQTLPTVAAAAATDAHCTNIYCRLGRPINLHTSGGYSWKI